MDWILNGRECHEKLSSLISLRDKKKGGLKNNRKYTYWEIQNNCLDLTKDLSEIKKFKHTQKKGKERKRVDKGGDER
jgi:hypothetical protein